MAIEANQIGIRELKKNLSRIIDQISKLGEPVVITKRGKPIAEITPIAQMSADEYIEKYLKGSVLHFEETHHDTTDDWECLN